MGKMIQDTLLYLQDRNDENGWEVVYIGSIGQG
jgi:hypothetical protein